MAIEARVNGIIQHRFERWEQLFEHVREILGTPPNPRMKFQLKKGISTRIGPDIFKCENVKSEQFAWL